MGVYQKKNDIEAIQFNGVNQADLFTLCGSKGVKQSMMTDALKRQILALDLGQGLLKLAVGDYLVRDGKGLTVMSAEDFDASFQVK